jgi:hypothetical protein
MRFSVRWLLAGVTLAALGCGAIMAARPIWATTALSVTSLLVALATVIAAVRGRAAPFCLGFAVFGATYLTIEFGSWASRMRPQLAPQRLVAWLSAKWLEREQGRAGAAPGADDPFGEPAEDSAGTYGPPAGYGRRASYGQGGYGSPYGRPGGYGGYGRPSGGNTGAGYSTATSNSVALNERQAALQTTSHACLALLFGCLGGFVARLAARARPEPPATAVPNAAPALGSPPSDKPTGHAVIPGERPA